MLCGAPMANATSGWLAEQEGSEDANQVCSNKLIAAIHHQVRCIAVPLLAVR